MLFISHKIVFVWCTSQHLDIHTNKMLLNTVYYTSSQVSFFLIYLTIPSINVPQHWHPLFCGLGFSVRRVPLAWLLTRDGSESRLSDILSQMISTNLSNTALTFMFSFADVSKNSKPETWNKNLLIIFLIKAETRGFSMFWMSWVILLTFWAGFYCTDILYIYIIN